MRTLTHAFIIPCMAEEPKSSHEMQRLGSTGGKLLGNVAFYAFLAIQAWFVWCIIVAFRGGTIPLLGIEYEGAVWTGILWLLIITPATDLVLYLLVYLFVHFTTRDWAPLPQTKDESQAQSE